MIFLKDDNSISEYSGDILIFPLYKNELEMFQKDVSEFEKYINLKYSGELLSEENFKTKFDRLYQQIVKDENNWAFNTMWLIVVLSRRAIVGTINFLGTPNENGEVEIEYAINQKFNNNSYTTNAVELLSNWSFRNGIRKITAKTEKTNIPAQKVLKNNDFVLKTENDSLNFYEKEVK